jgi:malate synthase
MREARQELVDAGGLPGFAADTAALRGANWTVRGHAQPDPDVCLAGLQGYREAAAWSARFANGAEPAAGGVLVRIDTVWATFEVEEILYELREVAASVRADHDGYLFSFIKTFHRYPECVLPDRADMTGQSHFLRAYSELLGRVCRRRGLPLSGDVAEPPAAGIEHGAPEIEAADLLQVPRGRITERGIRANIRTAIGFLLSSWGDTRAGDDAGRLDEEAAAELARAQLWQWVRHDTGVLDHGEIVTPGLFRALLDDELARLRESIAETDQPDRAAAHLAAIVLDESFTMHAFCERRQGE